MHTELVHRLDRPEDHSDRLRTRLSAWAPSPGHVLTAPATLLLLSLLLGPSACVLVLSFTDYSLGMSGWQFIGLDNYAVMLGDPKFWNSMRNTFVYVLAVLPLSVLLGLGAAVLIESCIWFRGFYRVAYFLPVTATLIAMATVWEFILHPNIGLLNGALSLLGFEKTRFLNNPDTALFALAGIGIWQQVGFNMVLFLAGLTAVPKELYAAAEVDGADGLLDRFLTVTWPMLGPTTLFVVVITAIRAFSVFETVAVLTNGGPNRATEVLLYSMYREGFYYFKVGYASALTVVFLTFTLALMLVKIRFLDRRVHYT